VPGVRVTEEKRELVVSMRRQRLGLKVIAARLMIGVNTVERILNARAPELVLKDGRRKR
jgi:hypothetical protein